jgi:hypothetical protein
MPTLLDRGAHGLCLCRHIACVLLLGAAVASASCDEKKYPTEPITFGFEPLGLTAVRFSAQSSTVIAQPVSHPRCPQVAPFNVPFVVVMDPNGATGVAVTGFRVQFTDSAGNSTPQTLLPAPVPVTPFGSALADARADKFFSLSTGVGCGVGQTGIIVVVVDTQDDNGHKASGRVEFNVR